MSLFYSKKLNPLLKNNFGTFLFSKNDNFSKKNWFLGLKSKHLNPKMCRIAQITGSTYVRKPQYKTKLNPPPK